LAPFRPDQFISVAKRVWLNPSPPSRAEWLRNQAAASLAASPRLPLEMRSEIAQHLLQEFAVCLLRTVRIGPTLEVRVDVSKTLDIEFVTYEGRSYIRNMTSSSRPTNCLPDTVYVAADTCGITDIIVCPANVRPCMDPVPGIWWSTILLTNPHTDIWLYTDVSSVPFSLLLFSDRDLLLTTSGRQVSQGGILRPPRVGSAFVADSCAPYAHPLVCVAHL
jgi:hypothetical protein